MAHTGTYAQKTISRLLAKKEVPKLREQVATTCRSRQDNTTTFYPTPVFMIQQFKMRDDYYNDVNIGRGMSILHADASETVD